MYDSVSDKRGADWCTEGIFLMFQVKVKVIFEDTFQQKFSFVRKKLTKNLENVELRGLYLAA